MILRKAFKYRLKTNKEIELLLCQYAGCNRKVWNMALAMQKASLEKDKKVLSYSHTASCLVQWKQAEETAFLKTAPSQSLQQTLKHLDRALKDTFDKKQPDKRFPVWKKKFKSSDSFRYPQGFKLEGNRIFLPKIGWVRFYKSRDIEGTPKNVTVSRRGTNWYISIQCEGQLHTAKRPVNDIIGIDMGVNRFLAMSTGESDGVDPINSFKKLQDKLARAQRTLARKVKFSNNWKKQKQAISRLHIKIADVRNDFLQKASTMLSKNHAMIVAEDLKIKNVTTSAKGSVEKPGKGVRVKSSLNRSILDQGWGIFHRMLEYKQQWSQGLFLKVDPANTSRTCPECGHVSADNRKKQSLFLCRDCGYTANADYVAAVNIKNRGIENAVGRHRVRLWRDGVSRLLKQKPVGKSDLCPLPGT